MIAMRDVFRLLGFEEDWQAMTDRQPGYVVDLGNIKFSANEVMGLSFRPVFALAGAVRTARTLRLIEFDCPLEVANVEQGVALLAHAVGADAQAERPTPWLDLGRTWQHHLPWIVESVRDLGSRP